MVVICHDTSPRPGQVHTPVYHCKISRTWWSSVISPPPDQGRYTHQYTTVRYHAHVVICHITSPRPGQVHTPVYHCKISRTWWSSVISPPPDQGRYIHQYTTVRYHAHGGHLSYHLPQTRAGTHTSIPL